MKTLKEWQEMPEIVLPWKGVETGFTLTSWKGVCPTCKVELVKPRGKDLRVVRRGGVGDWRGMPQVSASRPYTKPGISKDW